MTNIILIEEEKSLVPNRYYIIVTIYVGFDLSMQLMSPSGNFWVKILEKLQISSLVVCFSAYSCAQLMKFEVDSVIPVLLVESKSESCY